ncbi:MAG: arylesterase [Cytophagales bacterium]|nr:arylesterase [Cytophagales bacterium]
MKNSILVAILFCLVMACGAPEQKSQESTQTSVQDEVTPEVVTNDKIILFFGNSITAGYQLAVEQAFPAIIQKRLDSLDYDYRVVNAGLSGETTAGGKSRIDWVLRTVPDIFVLELGANDGLRGLPLVETPKNLQSIIDAVKEANPDVQVIIAGMMVPPNLGQTYTSGFAEIFPKVAADNDATLIPFLLDGVAGNPDLNLDDGIHPTPQGHKIVAETVWQYLSPLLEKDPA